ncbi:hypothetical protein H0E84_14210 [Luteimonas sp. SJ-92]|uniref:Uncharacterized protein n=1 Tax=Luteimonas salinisoli TaxID=2752307 RepID=A0A853JDY6_9GAMM|nr:hypothetical protein [Luteimonas salinisoli]
MAELYVRVDGRAERIWEEAFVPGQEASEKRLPPEECIPYPDEARAQSVPVLEPGKAYSSTLWAALTVDGKSSARTYHAYFCMVDEGGRLEPYQVVWSDRLNDWDWASCGRGVRW